MAVLMTAAIDNANKYDWAKPLQDDDLNKAYLYVTDFINLTDDGNDSD